LDCGDESPLLDRKRRPVAAVQTPQTKRSPKVKPMSQVLSSVLNIALAIHVVLIAVCVWRVWRGENVIDRLIGADLVGTLMLAVLVLIALILVNETYIDVALGLAALGFVSTIALAKYIADQQMF